MAQSVLECTQACELWVTGRAVAVVQYSRSGIISIHTADGDIVQKTLLAVMGTWSFSLLHTSVGSVTLQDLLCILGNVGSEWQIPEHAWFCWIPFSGRTFLSLRLLPSAKMAASCVVTSQPLNQLRLCSTGHV